MFPELPQGARTRRPKLTRAFFALWPDAGVRQAVMRAADQIPPGGAGRLQRVKSDRYHLTLAFLGNLEPRQLEAAARAGAEVRAAAFALRLDQVGHFDGPHVAWVGPSSLCRGLVQLKAELDRELLRFGLPVAAGAFVPHITCLRGVREPPDALPLRIDWTVTEFVLVKSVAKDGVSQYKIVRRWPLAGAAPAEAAPGRGR
ncbi:MAG: RNA 2',3'-cyclic phosphodiesterase [Nevskia sp.]|nr:RNA 2',3'-cyclic phosphodiesterase [Nevskia sp.]